MWFFCVGFLLYALSNIFNQTSISFSQSVLALFTFTEKTRRVLTASFFV